MPMPRFIVTRCIAKTAGRFSRGRARRASTTGTARRRRCRFPRSPRPGTPARRSRRARSRRSRSRGRRARSSSIRLPPTRSTRAPAIGPRDEADGRVGAEDEPGGTEADPALVVQVDERKREDQAVPDRVQEPADLEGLNGSGQLRVQAPEVAQHSAQGSRHSGPADTVESPMVDALVIGARCAETSCYGAAARAPRRSTSSWSTAPASRARSRTGHFIHRHGPARLRDWGLLDRVLATGCPPITSITTDFGDFPLVGRDPAVDGVPVGLGPRRAALDAVLVEAAVEVGAELREGFPVHELVYDEGRVVRSSAWNSRSERARLVIGADGKASNVARWVGGACLRGRADSDLLVLLLLERRSQ